MRRWIFWLLIAGLLWIVITRLAEIEDLAATLEQGQWEWVLVAAMLQVAFYTVLSTTYQSAFEALELPSRLRDLLPLVLGAVFVNVVAPSGGAAGIALFVDDAARRGKSPARTTVGMLLQLVSAFLAITLIVTLGLGYLASQRELQTYQVVGALVVFLVTTLWSTVLLLEHFRPGLLRRLLSWLQQAAGWLAGKIHRPPFLAEDWAEKTAEEAGLAAHAIARQPAKLARTVAIVLAAYTIDITSLYTLFLAFNQPIQVGPLVAGYAMGTAFWIVTPVPQGIGAVEAAMALVYSSLGVPGSVAATVALSYRGLSLWLPLALGAILLRRTRSFGKVPNIILESKGTDA